MPDGWAIKVTTAGRAVRPAIIRLYLAFEGDVDRAIKMVSLQSSLNVGETIEAIAPVTGVLLYSRGIKPGEVQLEKLCDCRSSQGPKRKSHR